MASAVVATPTLCSQVVTRPCWILASIRYVRPRSRTWATCRRSRRLSSSDSLTRAFFRIGRGGPRRGQEQQLAALKRQRAEKLGEAEVVADEQAAFVPVERKGREVIAGGVVLVLAHRGKEMRFVVGCETRALPVKDVGGVVHAPAAPVGDRAGDDVHVQLAGERRAQRLHRLAAAVAPLRQLIGGDEAGVPSFRQQRGVRALRRRASACAKL